VSEPEKSSAVQPRDSLSASTVPTKRPPPVSEKTATTVSAPAKAGEYSVQVAAYNHKADAEKLAASLVKQGYQARVDGDIVPFRVRIGRYSTEREAENALKKIKAKHMDGFVARAPQR
jgi:cell division protein FtsN